MYFDKSKRDFPISQQRLQSGGSSQTQLINPTPYITTPRVLYSFVTDYRTFKMRLCKGPSGITFTKLRGNQTIGSKNKIGLKMFSFKDKRQVKGGRWTDALRESIF
jgi:hypothetical protein